MRRVLVGDEGAEGKVGIEMAGGKGRCEGGQAYHHPYPHFLAAGFLLHGFV